MSEIISSADEDDVGPDGEAGALSGSDADEPDDESTITTGALGEEDESETTGALGEEDESETTGALGEEDESETTGALGEEDEPDESDEAGAFGDDDESPEAGAESVGGTTPETTESDGAVTGGIFVVVLLDESSGKEIELPEF